MTNSRFATHCGRDYKLIAGNTGISKLKKTVVICTKKSSVHLHVTYLLPVAFGHFGY